MRPSVSAVPPGANGAMIFTGFSGYSAAYPGIAPSTSANSATGSASRAAPRPLRRAGCAASPVWFGFKPTICFEPNFACMIPPVVSWPFAARRIGNSGRRSPQQLSLQRPVVAIHFVAGLPGSPGRHSQESGPVAAGFVGEDCMIAFA